LGRIVNRRRRISLAEVKSAIGFDQPKLRAQDDGEAIRVEGTYLLYETATAPNPGGALTEFEIRVILPYDFPRGEPSVAETAGRIPRIADRHVNGDGTCCVTVWEHWLATASDHSIAAFLAGPIHEYFLAQFWFEHKREWPFGERPHGGAGLVETYNEVLGLDVSASHLEYYLRVLSQDWPKGHWLCPCGSGLIIRKCHRDEMMALHDKVPSAIARRMRTKLHEQLPKGQLKKS